MKGLNLKKKLKFIAVTVFIAATMSITALAATVIDFDRTGSITVRVKDGEEFLRDGAVTLYKVGSPNEDLSGYVLTGDFVGADIPLDDIQDTDISSALRLESYANENGIEGKTVQINGEGKAVFSDLEPGLYLMVQTTACTGYEIFTPVLVSVPYLVEGEYIYDVTADEKTVLEKIPETVPDETQPDETQPDETTSDIPSRPGGGGGGSNGGGVRPGTEGGPGADVTGDTPTGGDSLSSDNSDSVINIDEIGGLPQTGESNTTAILIFLCAVFAVLLGAMFYLRRRTPTGGEE